jgi:hypothetical protein
MEPVDPMEPVEPVEPVDPVAPVGPAGPGTGVGTVTTAGVTTVEGRSHAVSAKATIAAEKTIEYFMKNSCGKKKPAPCRSLCITRLAQGPNAEWGSVTGIDQRLERGKSALLKKH